MTRMMIVLLGALGVAVAHAQAPAAPAATAPAGKQPATMDCSKAGIYKQQCEASMRANNPCYGLKDAELAACEQKQQAKPLRVRDCGDRTGNAKARCEANNARDKEAATAACAGKAGAELDGCVKGKLSDQKPARERAPQTAKTTGTAAPAAAPKAATTTTPKTKPASKSAPAATTGSTTGAASATSTSAKPAASTTSTTATSAKPAPSGTGGSTTAPATTADPTKK